MPPDPRTSAAHAGREPDAAFDGRPTHLHRLDNGLTVIVREDHASPVVAIVTHVRAGYFDEPDAIVGISHVLEHMFFKGTTRRGVGDLARETKVAGGYLNAGTIYDRTTYYTVLPSSAFARGLDIQADALRNSQIDEEELRRELLVIIQEARRKLDNPSAVAAETLYELMFDVHRMRRWRIGTEEGLRRLSRSDVWDYYRQLYRPSNIVLVVAGDVDPDEVLAEVERQYGDMPAGEVVRDRSPEEPERRGLRLREMEGDVSQAYLELGWRTPGTTHEDTAALDLLAVVLGQGRASRLFRGVRERGLVSSISAHNYTPTELGVFGVSAEGRPEEAGRALEAVAAEVRALAREAPDESEMQRARNILEARLVRRTETAEGQAMLLAEWQSLGDWRLADEYRRRIVDLEAEDVRQAARRYLDLDALSIVVNRPTGSPAIGADAEALRPRLDAAASPSTDRRSTEIPDVAPPPRSAPPRSARVRSVSGAEVHTFPLPGVELVVVPRRHAPLVSMGVVVRGGALHETNANAGVTTLTAQTSVKGTQRRSATRLAEESEALGGAISPGVSADLLTWSMSVPSRHFGPGFELLADAAFRPVFPADEVEREREAALSHLERMRDDMYRYPYRLFTETAFAGHAYGRSTAAIEANLRSLSAEDLRAWHEREVVRATPRIFVVGDVEPAAAAALVQGELQDFQGGAAPPAPAAPAWPDDGRTVVEQRERAQTALLLGFPGPARGDDDLYPLQVLANALSGLGGRFFDELRDRRSLAYTVSAHPLTRWLTGAFVAYIATAPEREDEARAALLQGFEELAESGLADVELEQSKRYTIGAWQISNQTNGARLGALSDALMIGAGLDDLEHLEERIAAVENEDVVAALRRHFDPGRVVEAVVRGR